jgi:hypothetical protein
LFHGEIIIFIIFGVNGEHFVVEFFEQNDSAKNDQFFVHEQARMASGRGVFFLNDIVCDFVFFPSVFFDVKFPNAVEIVFFAVEKIHVRPAVNVHDLFVAVVIGGVIRAFQRIFVLFGIFFEVDLVEIERF